MRLPRFALAGVFLLAAAGAGAQGIDAPVERYREAAAGREIGVIKGRAFEERRKPTGPDLPLTGTAIRLLPRSDAWIVRLQTIKRESRDSADAYRESAKLVTKARELYEPRLLEAGAGDLSQEATVDSEGAFALEGIPAGPWVLLASRDAYTKTASHDRRGPATPQGRVMPFLPPEKLVGYHVVTYWLRELTVAAGAVETVELTDRNAWLTGVAENRQAPPLPNQPFQPRR